MKIVTRNELAEYPVGTVFMDWLGDGTIDSVEGILANDIRIITNTVDNHTDETGADKFWVDELSLIPMVDYHNSSERSVRWITAIKSANDYDSSYDLFAIFNAEEVQQMINILKWALSGCKGSLNSIWYRRNITDTINIQTRSD